uniref:RH48922p n=1 Tax=Drosophila melanogaster TaxID=7227 RepID=C6TP12_DROME|nr:RH48922p [Drosophila melanogaster]
MGGIKGVRCGGIRGDHRGRKINPRRTVKLGCALISNGSLGSAQYAPHTTTHDRH